jgi:dihydropteroate synthase
VGTVYGIEEPAERDTASAAEALLACELGAAVVRVHNVAVTAAALKDLRPYVLLGLGGNVALVANPGEEREGKIAVLNKAIGDLCTMPDTLVVDIAPFYESEPAYHEEQEPFINTVVLMRTGLPPQELLKCCQAIENSLGRVRDIPNGPRTCDIDILDYQGYVSELEHLKLPHPRILERDFVVKPLLDIVPNHVLADGTPVSPDRVSVGAARRLG